MDSLVLKIRELCKQKNITFPALAKKIGKSQGTFYNYINEKTIIDVETLEKIAEVLEVDIREFFGGVQIESNADSKEIEYLKRENENLRKNNDFLKELIQKKDKDNEFLMNVLGNVMQEKNFNLLFPNSPFAKHDDKDKT